MQVKEIVYQILDEVKAASDDSFFTEEHVIFLIKKWRSLLIKKEQEREKADSDVASEFEYQQICLDLEKVEALDGLPCEEGYYLRTVQEMPKVLEGTLPRVYPQDYYSNPRITFVSRDRMKFVGTNKYLQNIIYTSLGPDLHLYLKSSNPQFLYLEGENKLKVSAVFEDFDKAAELSCTEGSDAPCDALDAEFPIRDYLVPSLIEYVVKELLGAVYRPKDNQNNAHDEMSGLGVKNSQ